MSYGSYMGRGPVAQPMSEVHDYGGDFDFSPNDPMKAATSVAVVLVLSAVFLTILKKSGFRAMVAVGRG